MMPQEPQFDEDALDREPTELDLVYEDLATANKLLAEQSAVLAKAHAALKEIVKHGESNGMQSWKFMKPAREAIAAIEGRKND